MNFLRFPGFFLLGFALDGLGGAECEVHREVAAGACVNAGCDLTHFVFKKEGREAGDAVILTIADTSGEQIGLFKVVSGAMC